MEKPSKIILNQALELPASERAILAEQLLMSLDLADSTSPTICKVLVRCEKRIKFASMIMIGIEACSMLTLIAVV